MILTTRPTSAADRDQILSEVDQALRSWVTYAPYLDFFRRELRWSRALPPEEVPRDVITMYSRFELVDGHTGQTSTHTLVLPKEADADEENISVLSPMGVALYGAREGQEVCWLSSAGPETATVKRVLYQPEAAGHHFT